jgi:hypothetical protein
MILLCCISCKQSAAFEQVEMVVESGPVKDDFHDASLMGAIWHLFGLNPSPELRRAARAISFREANFSVTHG